MDVADRLLIGRRLQPLLLVMERLQREASVRRLATSSSLGDVRVVSSHCLRLVDL